MSNEKTMFEISEKQREYDSLNGYGATVTVCIGLVLSLAVIGIPILLTGLFWAGWNAVARGTVSADIQKLKAQLV